MFYLSLQCEVIGNIQCNKLYTSWWFISVRETTQYLRQLS